MNQNYEITQEQRQALKNALLQLYSTGVIKYISQCDAAIDNAEKSIRQNREKAQKAFGQHRLAYWGRQLIILIGISNAAKNDRVSMLNFESDRDQKKAYKQALQGLDNAEVMCRNTRQFVENLRQGTQQICTLINNSDDMLNKAAVIAIDMCKRKAKSVQKLVNYTLLALGEADITVSFEGISSQKFDGLWDYFKMPNKVYKVMTQVFVKTPQLQNELDKAKRYHAAKRLLEEQGTPKSVKEAINEFQKIGEYRDSVQLCQNAAKRYDELLEAEKEKERLEAKVAARNRRIEIFSVWTVVLVIAAFFIVTKVIIPK